MQGRLHNLMTCYSMVYGLVFSGVAGSALSPLTVSEYDAGSTERTLANFFNFAASVQFSICVAGVLFTTFILCFLNSTPDTVIFRLAANFNFSMIYAYLIFYSTYLLLAQLCAIIFIRSDPGWAWATSGALLGIFFALFSHWIYAMRDAFPIPALHFTPAFGVLSFNPHIFSLMFGKGLAALKASAQHVARIMLQEATNNFGSDVVNKVQRDVARAEPPHGHALPQSPAHRRDEAGTPARAAAGARAPSDARVEQEAEAAAAAAAKQLEAMLLEAMPKSRADRRRHIASGLLIEELTLPRLVTVCHL